MTIISYNNNGYIISHDINHYQWYVGILERNLKYKETFSESQLGYIITSNF